MERTDGFDFKQNLQIYLKYINPEFSNNENLIIL